MVEHGPHRYTLNGRKELVMEGVQLVASFDEHEITLETNMGTVILKGEDLHITQLNLETGNLAAEGNFTAVLYVENRKSKGKGVLSRFLK